MGASYSNSKSGYDSVNTHDDLEPHKHNKGEKDIDEDLVYYITPLSIRDNFSYDQLFVQIPKNTAIPTKKFETAATTLFDNQKTVGIALYQGERKKASDNQLLGTLRLQGIQPALRGVPEIMVCLDIDAKGTLNVSIEEKSTGRKASKSIPGVGVKGKLVLTEDEVEKMARQGEKHKSEDKEYLTKVKVMKALEEYAIVIRENAAAGGYSGKVYWALKDVSEKMLDEFKEKAKNFGSESVYNLATQLLQYQ